MSNFPINEMLSMQKELQEKYKDNGIVVRSVSANIHGMSVDNVTITNVG